MKRRLLVCILALLMLPGCQESGDRVLVGKSLYDTNITPPRRYDVVVFKFPKAPIENGTPKNYIKRLLGLPGELIAIFFGQLFSFHHTGPGVPEGLGEEEWKALTDTSQLEPLSMWAYPPKNHETADKLWKLGKFEILRKPPRVMLALSRPVYDNDHQAKDLLGILPDRWAPQANAAWAADTANGFVITSAAESENWLRYRHLLRPDDWPVKDYLTKNAVDEDRKFAYDTRTKEIAGRLHMPRLITDFLGYNTQEPPSSPAPSPNWVGDLMLSCKLTVEEPKGEFWMELNKGVDRFQARFNLNTGVCSLFRRTTTDGVDMDKRAVSAWQLLATADTRVKAKGDYMLRFANYDQRLTVWVGRDLPFGDGKEYPAASEVGPDATPANPHEGLDAIKNNDLQPAGLCALGAKVQAHKLQLWRNTYYTDTGFGASAFHGEVHGDNWGHPDKWDPIRRMQPRTIYVFPGHYLCMGDNSPASSDSREWGLVPQRLMLGRALMVYFPFDRAGLIR